MSRILHLEDGSAIKADIVQSFDTAVVCPENLKDDGSINWNFVSSDMHFDVAYYSSEYIDECMEFLADEHERINA